MRGGTVCIPAHSAGRSPSPHARQDLLFLALLISAILTRVRWCLVVWIRVSPMPRDGERLSVCRWPSGGLLWRNVSSCPRPFFNWIVCFLGIQFDTFYIDFG